MSIADSNPRAGIGDATSVESEAADWVADRRNGEDWTSERQSEFDAWLAQSLAHRIAYLRIEATWRRTDRLAVLRLPLAGDEESAGLLRKRWVRIIAAIAFLAVLGVAAGEYLSGTHAQVIETPIGGREQLALADGSQIELNTNSAVRVMVSNNVRTVELTRGEAYFQIKHDPARPFIVEAAGHRIVDLGTKFLVRIAPQAVQVTLVNGRARLEDAGNRQHATVLEPGESAVMEDAGSIHLSRKSRQEIAESLAWQQGSIVFRNERLADAAAEFNRYGGPQLVVADADTAKLTVDGTFPTTGVEDFANVAREIFRLRVEHRNGTVVLSR